MNRTAEEVEIENLKERLTKAEAETDLLSTRLAKVEAAIGWAIAAATGIVAIVTALRSGVVKWLIGAGS